MSRTTVSFLLAIMWPSLQALFTVESEQDSYDAELHKSIRIGCRFSEVKSIAQLSVIWRRTEPGPALGVYRMENGLEKHNFTDVRFRSRARLLKEELNKFRAVLELSELQMSDSGTYQCIIRQNEADYQKTTLSVKAPYIAVKKNIRRLNAEEVELSCESQGFPLASVFWNDGRLEELHLAENNSEMTSEGIYNITSRVTVRTNIINNYTCSFILEGEVHQAATFNIPDEISGKSKWYHGLIAGLVVLTCVTFIIASLILHRRKKGQINRDISTACISSEPNLTVTSRDFLLPRTSDCIALSSEVCERKTDHLREVLRQRYAELNTTTETENGFTLVCGETQYHDIQSMIPGRKETVLLEGTEKSCKSSLAQKLAYYWAIGFNLDSFNISNLQLVMLLDFEAAKGDFFQLVKSKIPAEAGLETADVKEILQGTTDNLLILDGYKAGNREMDESLIKFLKDRRTTRVLITAQPGQQSSLGESVTTTLRLHTQPVKRRV